MPPTPSTVRYSAAAPSIVTQSDTRSHQPPQPPLPHSPPQISSATALLNSYTARHPIPSANAPSIATQSATRSHQPPAPQAKFTNEGRNPSHQSSVRNGDAGRPALL